MSDLPTPENPRAIELEIEVAGTPEEVWRAIATGPGIGSWYVPHAVEEREAERPRPRSVPVPRCRSAAGWPRGILHAAWSSTGARAGGMAFEWLVEARDGGSCVVRLVNTGFGRRRRVGRPVRRDDRGLEAVPVQPSAPSGPLPGTGGDRRPADEHVGRTARRGLEHSDVGARAARPTGRRRPRRRLGHLGRRASQARWWTPGRTGLALLVDRPARGTAVLAVEGHGEAVAVSVWSWLYGADGAAAAERDLPAWQAWLDRHAAPARPVERSSDPGVQCLRRRNRERGSSTARILRGSVAGSAIPRRISWVTAGSRSAAGASSKARA